MDRNFALREEKEMEKQLEARVEKLETVVRFHENKISHLLTLILSMHLALKHRDRKEAQIPFIIALVTIFFELIVELVVIIKNMRK